MLGWPRRWKLAHAFPWEHSYKGLELAQLLGQLGVFLTLAGAGVAPAPRCAFPTARPATARAGKSPQELLPPWTPIQKCHTKFSREKIHYAKRKGHLNAPPQLARTVELRSVLGLPAQAPGRRG